VSRDKPGGEGQYANGEMRRKAGMRRNYPFLKKRKARIGVPAFACSLIETTLSLTL
jgi:hypothetical protein